MQTRRSAANLNAAAGVGPLSIVLPRPTLIHRSSSSFLVSPHTPTTNLPTTRHPMFNQSTSSRKSSDSWSSSIDEREFDWYPDQILLLSRTLDALPSHLLTPFNGPIPPSGLLDKIARGIVDAKGTEWPHSVRATRLKLLEIARAQAASAHSIPEEPTSKTPANPDSDCLADSTNRLKPTPRRMNRQSSMDFLDELGSGGSKTSDRIDRLSSRLQRADRILATGSPYYNTRSVSRRHKNRLSASPSRSSIVGGPSVGTASSSTLASTAPPTSFRARGLTLKRSSSVLSSASSSMTYASSSRMSIDSVIAAAISSTESLVKDPKMSRPQRSSSFAASSGTAPGVKRAPSYGAIKQAKPKQSREGAISPCSSDEEEKVRSRTTVKKARIDGTEKVGHKLQAAPKILSSAGKTAPKKTATPPQTKTPVSPKVTSSDTPALETSSHGTKRHRITAKRNPSMLGAPLPVQQEAINPSSPPLSPASPERLRSPVIPSASSTPEQQASPARTLRRVKRLPARAPMGRKISFGSIAPGRDSTLDSTAPPSPEKAPLGRLGSAFTLA